MITLRLFLPAIFAAAVLALSLPAGAAPEDPVTLKGDTLTLTLKPPQKGGAVTVLRNTAGFDFVDPGRVSRGIWTITLRKIPTGPPENELVGLERDPEQNDSGAGKNDAESRNDLVLSADAVEAACEIERKDDAMVMWWRGIDVGGEKGALDLWISFAVKPGDRFVRVRAGFENRSREYTVFSLVAPDVSGIYPPDGKLEDDRFATPAELGRLIINPIRNGFLSRDPEKPERRRVQPNRASHSMQFDCYYHHGNGLYLGVFDPGLNVIRYIATSDLEEGLSWAPMHLPNNMKQVPQVWETPYDTVLAAFEGDWFDACRIYREWALRQDWAAEGPLASRKSTPEWFKQIDEWLNARTSSPQMPFDSRLFETLQPLHPGLFAIKWNEKVYKNIGNPDLFPMEEEASAYLAKAKQLGLPVMGFIQAICWDIESPSFLANDGMENLVRNFYGQKFFWTLTGESKNKDERVAAAWRRMALATPGEAWTKSLGSNIALMAKAGFWAAYLDSGNHAGTYLNFNPASGSDSGGGNSYIQANRRMLREIKAEARKFNPEFCLTAESFWEGNIAELDGFLGVNATNYFWNGRTVQAIPMVPAVYHDYTIVFGAWVSRHDVNQPGAAGYLAKHGQAFVWGIKPAMNEPNRMEGTRNDELVFESTRRRYEAYHAAKKFLVSGQMLREPQAVQMPEPMKVRWYRAWSKQFYDVSTPPVLVSMWKAPDGTIGLAAINISTEPCSVVLDLGSPGYGLGGHVEPVAVYGKHATAAWMEKRLLKLEIEGASPAVFEFAAGSRQP